MLFFFFFFNLRFGGGIDRHGQIEEEENPRGKKSAGQCWCHLASIFSILFSITSQIDDGQDLTKGELADGCSMDRRQRGYGMGYNCLR